MVFHSINIGELRTTHDSPIHSGSRRHREKWWDHQDRNSFCLDPPLFSSVSATVDGVPFSPTSTLAKYVPLSDFQLDVRQEMSSLYFCVLVVVIQADIVLRGYYGWNSRRAIQVLDRVFPKVWFYFPVVELYGVVVRCDLCIIYLFIFCILMFALSVTSIFVDMLFVLTDLGCCYTA